MASACATMRVCVGFAVETPMFARTLSKVTGCRSGHARIAAMASDANTTPNAMVREDQRGRRSGAGAASSRVPRRATCRRSSVVNLSAFANNRSVLSSRSGRRASSSRINHAVSRRRMR
jgi:hypothetical protein